jgi:hypothetical protein
MFYLPAYFKKVPFFLRNARKIFMLELARIVKSMLLCLLLFGVMYAIFGNRRKKYAFLQPKGVCGCLCGYVCGCVCAGVYMCGGVCGCVCGYVYGWVFLLVGGCVWLGVLLCMCVRARAFVCVGVCVWVC